MIRKFFFFALLLPISTVAFAGATITGTITHIQAYSVAGFGPNGLYLVTFSASGTGGATCGSTYPSTLAVDVTTPAGSAVISSLQLAKVSGDTVTASGTGSCTVGGNVETLGSVYD